MAEKFVPPADSFEAIDRIYAREPLTEELDAMRRGDAVEDAAENPVESSVRVADEVSPENADWKHPRNLLGWTPSRKQLVALHELRGSDGWAVLMLLMKKRLEKSQQSAMNVSHDDPLRNQELIATEWAYHRIHKLMLDAMEKDVMEQLERLRRQE